jgi:hypothetical protein
MTSNMVEAMNSTWLQSRELPPLLLLADLWIRAMKVSHERRHHQHGSMLLTDYVKAEMEKEREHSRRFTTAPSDEFIGLVFPPEGASFIANWIEGTCTCLAFQDRGFPCRHAFAMARNTNLSSLDKVNAVYSLANYRATYSQSLPPIQVENLPMSDLCLPPATLRPRGRPRKNRIRRDRRGTRTYRCGRCGKQGHTRKRCTNTTSKCHMLAI